MRRDKYDEQGTGCYAYGSLFPGLRKPRLRTKKRSSLSSEVITSTNTSTLREHHSHPYSVSGTVTQTPTEYDAPTPLTASFIGSKPPEEETHLQVDFSVYADAIFGPTHRSPGLDEVVDNVTRCDEFSQYRRTYLERYEAKKMSSKSLDPDVDLMRLFNFVLAKARSLGLSYPYTHDIHYGKRPERTDDALGAKGSPVRPGCLGVECVLTEDGELGYEFSNSILIIDCNPNLMSKSSPIDWFGPPQPVHNIEVPALPIEPCYDRSPGGTKGPRDNNLGSSETTRGSSKRRKLQHPPPPRAFHPSPHPPNLTRYALETLCTIGNRRHVLGLHVEGERLQFWYFDRAGSISTTPLSLTKDAGLIASTILRLSLASKARLGYDSFFEAPSAEGMRRLWWSIDDHEVEVEGERYQLLDIVHSGSSLYGRGTAVYGARRIPKLGMEFSGDRESVIVKCAWQPVSKCSEDELLRIAQACGVDGIAKLFGSAAVRLLSEGVRGRLCSQRYYQDRQLRVQVMGPRCMPLYKVKDLDVFKQAFISLVKAHHELYEKAGILHRDVSINNLMVHPEEPRKGVLIDFDMAVLDRDPKTGIFLEVQPYPGGTLPFRAAELCQEQPLPRSLYRHDLESFFFVLIWIMFHRSKINPDLCFGTWCSGNWVGIHGRKQGFLLRVGEQLPRDLPLLDEWIKPLWTGFAEGYSAMFERVRASKVSAVDVTESGNPTLCGHVTYATYMKTIN